MIPHNMRDVGIVYKIRCNKEVYKDDLCKKHYNARVKKLTNWIDRAEYIPATQNDLDSMRSLKLKHTHVHKIYRCLQGIIKVYNQKQNKFLETDIKPDYNLFCVKKY
jgi:hypothetical protein